MKQKFTIGCFAIIFDDKKRILCCLRGDYDLWNLPGGAMEQNESPWECVIREVKEETGLDVKVEKLLGLYFKPEQNDLVFCFLCEQIGGHLTINKESRDFKYFKHEELPDNFVPKQLERIKHAYEEKDLIMTNQSGPPAKKVFKHLRLKTT